MTTTAFRKQEYQRATAWKMATSTLPDDARSPATYHSNTKGTVPYSFCLPVEFSAHALLPEVRATALALFTELGIPWHAATPAGPSNHLLDSQVQCVNALGRMVHDPERIKRAFGSLLDIGQVLEVEPGRHLTFEFIGSADWFGEGNGKPRVRGTNCTSVDAAFLHRCTDGTTELVLVEWKYTEAYTPKTPSARADATRFRRYGPSLHDPLGPVRSDLLPFEALVQEPFYQLMRQQLFAWRCEVAGELGADRVRVVHVVPAGNDAYESSLADQHRALGESVSEVWSHLLRATDRYLRVDSDLFLDPAITSAEYVARYGPLAEPGSPGRSSTMTKPAIESLLQNLVDDPHTLDGSVVSGTDRKLSIGTDVVRLTWRGAPTCAVAADATLSTTCGAILDAVALHHHASAEHPVAGADNSAHVHVLIDRPLPERGGGTEADQAVRSLRDAASRPTVSVWYREGDAWVTENSPSPSWSPDDPRVTGWVHDLLLPRLTTQPHQLALDILHAVDDPSASLYPSEISLTRAHRWALRLDGLEVGVIDKDRARLTIGGAATIGDGPQRAVFVEVIGVAEVVVCREPVDGEIGIEAAAGLLRELMRRFRGTEVPGAPVQHRPFAGTDEHAFEARLLKGLTHLDRPAGLVQDDVIVARGSQFPTLWGIDTRPRYLDALLRRDAQPLAIELKVATGGMGRYYRRAIAQAVLYRHFILNCPALEPWFKAAGLDRAHTAALVGLPIPMRWSAAFSDSLDLLRQTAATFGVQVEVIDADKSPEWENPDLESEIGHERFFELRRLVADELIRLWPQTFKEATVVQECGGAYNTLRVHDTGQLEQHPPFVSPYVTLGASAWVFNQLGEDRWVWRGIWDHLHNGGDVTESARTIGIMTGLGPPTSG